MFSLVDFVRNHLTLKIMLVLTFGVALVMTTVISLSVKNQRQEMRGKMTEFGRELGALAYAGIKHPMAVGDSASIEKELSDIQDRLQGAEIVICDFDQRIVFATDTKRVNTQISQFIRNKQAVNVITKALQTDSPGDMITFEEKEGENRYLISMDIILNEKECHHCHGATRKVLGALLSRHSANSTYTAIAKLRNRTIAISLFGLGLILGFIYLVTRPLTELVTTAKQLARGDLTVPLPVKGKDSIGILGSAFNSMVISIKDQIELANSLKKVIADPMFIVDLNMVVTYMNDASALLSGYSREEVEGKMSCREILQCDICDSNCPVQKTLKEEKSVRGIRTTIISRHDQEIQTMASASVLKDSGGMVVGVVVVHTLIGPVKSSHDVSTISTNAIHSQEISQDYSFHNIISKNEKIQKIFSILPSFAKSDSTVLIEGASGSGKELFAKAIHELSERKGQFIALNCAALPDTLLESELFGYKKGAFTGALKNKPGRFALAENGTIFLDEIGDISPLLQLKLLRILQEKEFEPLGGTATVKANVRVIAATNKNLKELVKKSLFRKDLFFRLNVINISLPPLSERREDIPLLAHHFIDKFNILKQKNIELISARALNILMRYEFPGNVRELENIIEYCFAVCQDKVIDIDCLPEGFAQSVSGNILKGSTEEATPLSNAEATTILAALKEFSGNRTKTAEYLGIDKTTLWRKMKKYKIDFPARKN